ncbi:PREDICTED: uncharacterized protein LOC100631580 [Amphimedon queenslandica]|uniref:SEA domain-containing protein n=1 Tax=Amphimedon queenslandica TaxID=400682 RepID=A0AAN0IGN5_AMPQE|nr:PREDICTED: uncharacterized protein LOC100631580 [Amphimedon queenslandica]|eukprot:XP_003388756.1 PREDICTED: uncharacterized protein LOC100631580 [Amphimedon queenslandica]
MKLIAVVLLVSIVGAMAQNPNLTDVQDRFESSIAMQSRQNHFFCLERTTTDMGMVEYTSFEQDSSAVWTLYVQMPLLGYLDVSRKGALMDIVSTLASINSDNLCIGTYEVTDISTFRESILIHIYGDSNRLAVNDIVNNFDARVRAALNNANDMSVINYPSQAGIITFNLTASSRFENPLYAGDQSSDGAVPINLAVYLGSYAGNLTFGTPVNNVSSSFGSNTINTLASNPNPINYGLEAGDIAFAVIGSILLTVVMFLIILGYFIHPFFLA